MVGSTVIIIKEKLIGLDIPWTYGDGGTVL
jgi:hypothetical protein